MISRNSLQPSCPIMGANSLGVRTIRMALFDVGSITRTETTITGSIGFREVDTIDVLLPIRMTSQSLCQMQRSGKCLQTGSAPAVHMEGSGRLWNGHGLRLPIRQSENVYILTRTNS